MNTCQNHIEGTRNKMKNKIKFKLKENDMEWNGLLPTLSLLSLTRLPTSLKINPDTQDLPNSLLLPLDFSVLKKVSIVNH
jgi:hypothetical protein